MANPRPNSHPPQAPVSGVYPQTLRASGVYPTSFSVGGAQEAYPTQPSVFYAQYYQDPTARRKCFGIPGSNLNDTYYQDPNVEFFLKNWAFEVLQYYGSSPNDTGATNAALNPNGNSTKKKVTPPPPATSGVSTDPLVGPQEIPASSKVQKTKKKAAEPAEVLETKRSRIMEEGVASDAIRVCGICNVVCNSKNQFAAHNAGKKHASMMVKQRMIGKRVIGNRY